MLMNYSCVKENMSKKKPRLIAKVGTQTLICPESLIEQGSVIRIYEEIATGVTAVQFNFVDPDADMGFIINSYFSKTNRNNECVITDIDDATNYDNWSVGQLNTNLSAGLSGTKTYVSHNRSRGKFVITSVDEVNKVMSGYFQFTAYAWELNSGTYIPNGGSYYITGEFEAIPLSDGYANFFAGGTGGGNGGGGNGGGGGGGGGGVSNTTIIYKNTSFTNMDITVNNVTKTAAPNATVSFTGSANSTITGSAKTSGATSSSTQVGLMITWNFTGTFPASGTSTINIEVPGTYFFLRIKNNSSRTISKVYVNYGLVSQTLDNITLSNGGQTFNIGYYKAFSNSNVRAESGSYYWSWNSLVYQGAVNRLVTVVAN